MTKTAAEVDRLKQAPAVEGVLPVILQRWSPRAFADKPVPRELLAKAFEAARWAASSYNEQPWRFLVGFKGDDTYAKILDALVEFNQLWAQSAPVLIVGIYKQHFTHNDAQNTCAYYDLGAATAYLMLEAAALGLHTHSMAGISGARISKSFNLPDEFQPGPATALGYQGDPAMLTNEHMLQQETSPRTRKPLNEIVLKAWDEPAEL